MEIAARHFMQARARLPYDAKVEWLESTGAQWIDMGLNLQELTDVVSIDMAQPTLVGGVVTGSFVIGPDITTGGIFECVDLSSHSCWHQRLCCWKEAA